MSLRVGLVGAGTMGSLHARVVAGGPDTSLEWISDPDEPGASMVAQRFGARWCAQPNFDDVDAVVIAAPTEYHSRIALEVLERGLPLLLEKPLAASLADTDEIISRARRTGGVLMCGLLERFNPAVRTAFDIARDPIRLAVVRHSPFPPRIRGGVAADLVIHDADLAIRLFGSEPEWVAGQFGHFHPDRGRGSEDIVEAIARFTGGRLATLSANRLAQTKVRTMVVTEMKRTIEVDMVRQSITVLRNVDMKFDDEAGYSQQTVIDIPVIRHNGEPLQLQLAHFVALIREDADRSAELDSLRAPHAFVDLLTRVAQAGDAELPAAAEDGNERT